MPAQELTRLTPGRRDALARMHREDALRIGGKEDDRCVGGHAFEQGRGPGEFGRSFRDPPLKLLLGQLLVMDVGRRADPVNHFAFLVS